MLSLIQYSSMKRLHSQSTSWGGLMNSSIVRKISKARDYAEQSDRIKILQCKIEFQGENSTHQIQFNRGIWLCDCNYFYSNQICSHSMALEIFMKDMLASRIEPSELLSEVEEILKQSN